MIKHPNDIDILPLTPKLIMEHMFVMWTYKQSLNIFIDTDFFIVYLQHVHRHTQTQDRVANSPLKATRGAMIKVTFDINWKHTKQSANDYLPSQADLHF